MRTSRTKKQYIDGVEAFIKYAVHNLQKMRNIDPRGNKQQLMMPCPCTTCLNHIEHKVEEVQFYLFKYGIDLSYTKWDKHGEKDEQATTAQIPVNATIEFFDDTDFNMDFGSEIPTDGPTTVEMVNATKECFDKDDLANFQELLLDAEKPLYKGCPDFTKLFAIVKLLNLMGKYRASDKFFTELLGLLKKMLLVGNEMVEKNLSGQKTNENDGIKIQKDTSLTGVNPSRSKEGSLQLADLMALCTSLQRKVNALEKDKLIQATEILSLKKRGMISDIDVDAEISLVDETQRLDDDLVFDTTTDLGGEEVVVKPAETGVSPALNVEVSVADPAVTTVNNDITMAEALAELKTSKPKVVTTVPIFISATTVTTTKPKAKGITIQEPSVTQKIAVSFISSSKGKAIMIESKKPVKIKDQISHDERVTKDIHDKIQVELEEEAKGQEKASITTIAKLYDVVQAQIYADQKLAARMTLEEHEKCTVEDRARMLAELIKIKKKQLAVKRAEAIRSKPPTKSQLRNLMITYLKNTGRFTHAQLKNRDFEEIQGLYNKEKELVDTFFPIGYEEDERRIKELNTKAEEESSNKDVDSTNKRMKRIQMKRSSKKQKTDADLKKEEQLKTFLSKVPNEEEAINYEVLDKRVFRADGNSRYIKTFTEMVSRFDRMDFWELRSLVMQRFRTTTPEGIDLILWGDLKTMFEANAVDKLWKNQEDWILKS
ncbi:putative reverse transcriptase domain-containing protein [Tanacetum coccineum]|uniref:Reverse transcriptase domain-containing protein n=1 Tax=Tanacetum coccineum TaxID=301880 RepID=A0ABQ5C827_9ASTR